MRSIMLATTSLIALASSAGLALAQDMLEPLPSGFPSGPLTLFVVDEPGSADSIYANQLVEAAQKFSPVPIRVEHRQDFTNFGTWEALAWVRDQGEQGNDGTISFVVTVPGSIIDLLAIDMETELGVGLDDLNIVLGTEQLPYFLYQRADAPWGDTLDDLVTYATENPGEVRYISGGIGGSQDAAMQWYLRQLDIEVNTIIGGGGAERALTVASGQGDITVSPPDLILPHYEGGRVEMLMVSGANPSPEPWTGVPNSVDAGMENDPWGQLRGIAVSPEAPAENTAWLAELYTLATEDPDFIAKREQVPGLQLGVVSREDAIAVGQSSYDAALPIFRELGAYWGDQ